MDEATAERLKDSHSCVFLEQASEALFFDEQEARRVGGLWHLDLRQAKFLIRGVINERRVAAGLPPLVWEK